MKRLALRDGLVALAIGLSGGLIWQAFHSLHYGYSALVVPITLLVVGVVMAGAAFAILFRKSAQTRVN